MSMADDIGKLIVLLNPYTQDSARTGPMDIYVGNPSPATIPNDYSQVELEVDTNYPGTWNFKGEAQRINTAARIRYRYPVKDSAGNVAYWIDDYLLVGFEGSGGP